MTNHKQFMTRCIALGEKSMALGNAPVGSLVVKDDLIIGEGLELGTSKNDITFHAEIEAIRAVLNSTKTNRLSGCTLYTTHEPCMMCAYIIRHYGIETVYFGLATGEIGGYSSDFNILETEKVLSWSNPPNIVGGLLKSECEALHDRFKQSKED